VLKALVLKGLLPAFLSGRGKTTCSTFLPVWPGNGKKKAGLTRPAFISSYFKTELAGHGHCMTMVMMCK
jgi:hypothetical protein